MPRKEKITLAAAKDRRESRKLARARARESRALASVAREESPRNSLLAAPLKFNSKSELRSVRQAPIQWQRPRERELSQVLRGATEKERARGNEKSPMQFATLTCARAVGPLIRRYIMPRTGSARGLLTRGTSRAAKLQRLQVDICWDLSGFVGIVGLRFFFTN